MRARPHSESLLDSQYIRRLSVLMFTPLLRSLKRASVVIHLVRVAGTVMLLIPSDMQVLVVKAKKCQG